MVRNGFFGVKNAHFAILKDEDALTYDAPVHVPGTVSISMEPTIGESTSYADNETWLQEQQDNGGSGVMSFYDTESDEKVRKLIAELAGFGIAADGRIILSANKNPKPFAFMAEQPGHVLGRRRCLYYCQMKKPKNEWKTNEDTPQITQLDYDFTWRPITLPESNIRTSGYDSFSGIAGYDDFFKRVDTAITEAPAGDA